MCVCVSVFVFVIIYVTKMRSSASWNCQNLTKLFQGAFARREMWLFLVFVGSSEINYKNHNRGNLATTTKSRILSENIAATIFLFSSIVFLDDSLNIALFSLTCHSLHMSTQMIIVMIYHTSCEKIRILYRFSEQNEFFCHIFVPKTGRKYVFFRSR